MFIELINSRSITTKSANDFIELGWQSNKLLFYKHISLPIAINTMDSISFSIKSKHQTTTIDLNIQIMNKQNSDLVLLQTIFKEFIYRTQNKINIKIEIIKKNSANQ